MTVHMVHAPIDVGALMRWTGDRKLIRRGTFDDGWALHTLLSGMFGKGVLQPFRMFWSDQRRTGTIYAYTSQDRRSLQETARMVAPPEYCSIIRPERICTKQMPQVFRSGQRFGFDLRARPVRRVQEDVRDTRHDKVVKKGSEVDAYWLERLRMPEDGTAASSPRAAEEAPVRRERCYHEWLSARVANAAEVKACRIRSFRRAKAIRGRGIVEGPDVVLHGELVLGDTDGFAKVLRHGVGRHKAYGYGMLLLRPAARHGNALR